MRIGYNRLIYTTTGMALDAEGKMLYIAKISGFVEISEDCNFISITNNTVEIFPPVINPFTDGSVGQMSGMVYFGRRAHVDLP